MKITNKLELQQIPFNHSSDIEFKDSMNLHKNMLQNHILFASDNPSRFRKKFLQRI